MQPYTAQGVVLRRRDLGDNDRIVTLLTCDRGKLDAVAKGARKAGAKSTGASEPFTEVRTLIARGRSLDIVTQWQVLDAHAPLRCSLGALARASYACDLVHHLTVEHEPCPEVHGLLTAFLSALAGNTSSDGAPNSDALLHAFELRLLAERGYALATNVCAACGQPLDDPASAGNLAFSASQGGGLCSRCRFSSQDSFTIGRETLNVIAGLREGDVRDCVVRQYAPAVETQLRRCLRWSVRYRCEREMRSASFLELVRREEETGQKR